MRTTYLILATAVFAAAAAAADDGAPAVDTASPPTEGSNGDSSNVDASQTEAATDPGAAPGREDPLLDTKVAGGMSDQEKVAFYRETANSHAAVLRKFLPCARWGVVAMEYVNSSPKFAAVNDDAPMDPFQAHGVGATVAYPGSKYPVWVVYLYRRFANPPTRSSMDARNDIIGSATTCIAKNELYAVVPPDNAAAIVKCTANIGRGNSAGDYVVVTDQLRYLVAVDIPPRTTIWTETVKIADEHAAQHGYLFILQP